MRYFQLQKAERPVAGITFERVDVIGGVLWGVYATDKEKEIADLLEQAKNPRLGLSEINLQEYMNWTQKKTQSSQASQLLNTPTPVMQRTPIQEQQAALANPPIKGTVAAVVEAEPTPMPVEETDETAGTKPIAIEQAVFIAPVDPPKKKSK